MPAHQQDPKFVRSLLGNAAGATIVGSLGIILIVMVLTGQINNYLQPSFRPWLLLTGTFLICLAIWTLLSIRKHTQSLTQDNPMRRSSWLMTLPLLIAVIAAPAPLGAAMINSGSIGSAEGIGDGSLSASSLPEGPTMEVSPEYVENPGLCRVGHDENEMIEYSGLEDDRVNELTIGDIADRFTCGDKDSLNGKQVRISGFLSEGSDGHWQLNRYKIFCCAAHALPYSVILVGELEDPVEDQWYEVTGTLNTESSDLIPDLQIEQMQQIPQPQVPYL